MWISGLIVVLKIPNPSKRIVCIRVQWNHSDLSGYSPQGAGWTVARKQGVRLFFFLANLSSLNQRLEKVRLRGYSAMEASRSK